MSALSTGPLLNDAHRWWKSAKAACGMQTCDTVPSLLHQGCMKTSAEDKADCLNSVFAEQCSAPPSTGKPRVSSTSVNIPESFFFHCAAIAQESVKKSLSKLNAWKAVGPDGIPHRVLKECAATLAEPLTFIFNCSLTSGLFPIQWKQGVIKTIVQEQGSTQRSKLLPTRRLATVCFESVWRFRSRAATRALHEDRRNSGRTVWFSTEAINFMADSLCCGWLGKSHWRWVYHSRLLSRCRKGIRLSGPHPSWTHAVDCRRASQGALLVC